MMPNRRTLEEQEVDRQMGMSKGPNRFSSAQLSTFGHVILALPFCHTGVDHPPGDRRLFESKPDRVTWQEGHRRCPLEHPMDQGTAIRGRRTLPEAKGHGTAGLLALLVVSHRIVE